MQTPQKSKNGQTVWIILLVVAGLVLIAVFGMRAVRSFRFLRHGPPRPDSTDVSAIRGWMSFGYIEKVYAVPPDVLEKGLNLPARLDPRLSLSEVNQKYFPGQQGYVLERVKEIVADFQAAHAPPTPPAPPADGTPTP